MGVLGKGEAMKLGGEVSDIAVSRMMLCSMFYPFCSTSAVLSLEQSLNQQTSFKDQLFQMYAPRVQDVKSMHLARQLTLSN